MVTSAAVRTELAEDLTARTVARCVPLLQRSGVPEHVRALTSPHVLEVEDDLVTRLAARGTAPHTAPTRATATATGESRALDLAQQRAVDLLASDAQLVVIEGAAGAGKTTTLAAARAAIERDGRRLVVVTPTRKAAQVAAGELGTSAFSAAWLAHQHGFRWDEHGTWSRLAPGDIDQETRRPARCTPARARARGCVAVTCCSSTRPGCWIRTPPARCSRSPTSTALGSRCSATGTNFLRSGGAACSTWPCAGRIPTALHTLDTVHRFVRATTAPDGTAGVRPDDEYARLSLAMRGGDDPAGVFDALLARGQLVVHASEQERLAALAATAAAAVRTGSRAGAGRGHAGAGRRPQRRGP